MGCASSKVVTTAADVYRPPPSSFAVFDINSIQEPWLSFDNPTTHENQQEEEQQHQKKPAAPVLDKLNKLETDTPRSWSEVSKALEDLKPALNNNNTPTVLVATSAKPAKLNTANTSPTKKPALRKSTSIHTLEELEEKLSSKQENQSKKTEFVRPELKKKPEVDARKTTASTTTSSASTESLVSEAGGNVIKPVKENIFIVRDRLEREKEGKKAIFDKILSKRDPLSEFPEKCPPEGEDRVVVYTTSLRGVRRTHEDCNKVRDVMELLHIVYDERDVSLHAEYLKELKSLFEEEESGGGEGNGSNSIISVPRVFVKGRYIGGVEEVVEMNESGRLGRLMSWARVERGVGWRGCEGCGGARFLPCFDCGGSCKVLVDDVDGVGNGGGGVKERCVKCNENGLVRCPLCL